MTSNTYTLSVYQISMNFNFTTLHYDTKVGVPQYVPTTFYVYNFFIKVKTSGGAD